MRNLSRNKIFIILGGLVLFVLSIWGGVRLYDLTHPYQAKYFTALGYDQSEVKLILAQVEAIKADILEQAHIPNIIKHLTIEHYSDLIKLGYSDLDAELLLDLEDAKLAFVLSVDKNDKIVAWIQEERFLTHRYQRYLNVLSIQPNFTDAELFEWVNTNRDRLFYTAIQESDPALKNLVLVNKYYALAHDFVPSDLQSIAPHGHGSLQREAADAFKQLASDAKAKGYTITGMSGYRSFQTQAELYQRYVKEDGQVRADTYSARPGHSEHQTGLAIDVASHDLNILNFGQSQAYPWMLAHAHEYGFILRYPEGKEAITGYRYEPWHYRYVGIENAKMIKKSGMTFDEYAAVYILD